MKIKICGITNAEDAALARELGADIIGFIFAKSPRHISVEKASAVAAKAGKGPEIAGVFVNESPSVINRAARRLNLDYVQLCGDEPPSEIKKIKGARIIKALRVNNKKGLEEKIKKYGGAADIFLLDTYKKGFYGGTGSPFDWNIVKGMRIKKDIFIAGGLTAENVGGLLREAGPVNIDASSGLEKYPGKKSAVKMRKFFRAAGRGGSFPDKKGFFGRYGGRYAPETLRAILESLEKKYYAARRDKKFKKEFTQYLKEYVGRPTPLYFAANLSKKYGARVYLKREDLCHTGAHKINNTMGQVLLARRLDKKRIIAETGAGQHGVATATVAAMFNMPCEVYMGEEDMRRQALNVFRMEMLGAAVIPVKSGTRTLKDAMSEAVRDWLKNVDDTFYIIGSVAGFHPYPVMVRDFQSVIGREAKKQVFAAEGRLPDYLIACVGGGSNAMGIFYPFLKNENVKLVGVEAAGRGLASGKHAATLVKGRPGVLHGSKTYVLQDRNGQIQGTHSISAGLDYPGVGPEHSFLKDSGRAEYGSATDKEAMSAFKLLSEKEGIMPALEPAHALAYLDKMKFRKKDIVIVNLSGRGDKDIDTAVNYFNQRRK